MIPKYKIAIIILTYNSSRWIKFCIESLSPLFSRSDIQIILVDNASKDDTVEKFKEINAPISLIELKRNLGCAGGNNAGWRASDAEFIIFLNPDVVVKKAWIDKITEPLEKDKNVGVVGCKLYYPNSHKIQHAGGILYPNMMCDHYGNCEEDKGQYDKLKEVDFVTGAAFSTPRFLLEELNGFDESFFPAYYEETDYCFRLRKIGYKIIYNPQAVAYHYESSSLTKLSDNFYRTFYKSRIHFLVKHYSFKDWFFKFLPFEIKWMLYEPKAKTTRFKQFKAYLYIPYFLYKKYF